MLHVYPTWQALEACQYMQRKTFKDSAIIICLWILCLVSPTTAKDIRFNHLTSANGLTHNAVTAQFLDSRGFMWIGTAYGLSRYDGYEFKTFRPVPEDSLSLPSHWIRTINEDAQGRLFIGTAQGLVQYNRNTETFHRIAITGDTKPHIVHLKIDQTGKLWVSTGFSLFRVTLNNKNKVVNARRVIETPNKEIFSLLEDQDGSMWLGTENGLAYWHAQSDSLRWYPSLTQQIGTLGILTLHRDARGQVWAGTEHGLYAIDKHAHTFTKSPPFHKTHTITSVFDDTSGRLWIGTRNKGLLVTDIQSGETTHLTHLQNDPSSLSKGTIVSIISDHSNMIWVGTYGGGISLHTPNKQKIDSFTHDPDNPKSLNTDAVFSVLKDKDDNLWVGTANGVNRFTPKGHISHIYKQTPHAPSNISHNVVRALHEDKNGQLWIGTDAGLNLLDRKTEKITVFQHDVDNPNSLSDNTIRRIHEDKNGILWIGTNNGGLNRFDPITGQFTRLQEEFPKLKLSTKCIRAIYQDPAGTLWLGTSYGFASYRPNTKETKVFLHNPEDPTTISSNSIYAIAPAIDGGLWIGTRNGLNYFDTSKEQFSYYTTQDGLISNIIYNIFLDSRNNLWVNTDRGISRIQISSETGRKQLSVRNFDQTDGVVGTEFNTGASYQTSDGTLFMGSMSGLNVFHPDSLQLENTHRPPIVFTSCEIYTGQNITGNPSQNLSGISEKTIVHLPYTTTHIRLSFSALDFVSPEKNEYAYWLQGLESDWIQLKHQRHLNLSLAPGTYQLHVQGSNNDGLWNKNGRTLSIVVATPYWMTHWFRVGAIICAIALINTGYRIRLKNIRAKNNELDKLVKELEIKNTELERFTYTVSHDLKSPLVTIEGFLGMIEKDVNTKQYHRVAGDAAFIRNAVANMRDLLDDLLDLSRVGRIVHKPEPVHLESLAKEAANLVQGRLQADNIALSISGAFPTIMGDRRRLLEVFQNLLDNAAKFTADCPNPQIEVGIRQEGQETVIIVKDNGIGIDSRYHTKVFGLFERLDTHTEGTGIGLALVKRIVEFHNGRIWVESEGPGKGSALCFTLPGIQISDDQK